MNKKTVALLVAAGAVLAPSAFAPRALAQQPAGPDIRTSAGHRLELDHTHFVVHNSKPAVAHKPLEIIDPQTHKPLEANKDYNVNGHMVKGSEILKNYNLMEQYLNGHGLSHTTAQDKNALGKIDADEELEAANHARLTSHVTPPPAARNAFLAQGGQPLPTTTKAAKTQPRAFNWDRSWAFDKKAGNNKNGLDIGASFEVHVSNMKQRAEAKGYLTGTLIGHGFDILRADAFAEADETNVAEKGAAHAGVKLTTIMGKELWGKSYDSQNSPIAHGSFPVYNFSWSPQFPTVRIPIGPFEVTVDVGVKFGLGVDAKYALYVLSARADGVPHGTVDADIKAGIGIVIAHVGVGGNINLIKDQFDLGGIATLQESEDGQKVQLALDVFGKNHLEGLSGKFFIWAKVGVHICCGCCEKEWDLDVASWKAPLHLDTTVFEWKQPIDLFAIPQGNAASAPPAAVLEPLHRLQGPHGSSFVSVGNGVPAGYSHSQVVGKVESGAIPGTKPLYACVYTTSETRTVRIPRVNGLRVEFTNQTVTTKKATGEHFESLDASCEGHLKTGVVAYVWSAAGPGRHELFRCRTGNESFITTSASCDGKGQKQQAFFVAN